MTRSSYIIYWISMLLACFIGSRSFMKRFLEITFPSVLLYLIFYIFFYRTYPGSGIAYLFTSGMTGMESFDNFFITSLSKFYEITNAKDVNNLDMSFIEFIKIIFTDIKLIYGIFVNWIFKILSSLGFRHLTLLWDARSIYIQRFSTLLYFIFFMGPAFFISSICLIFIPKNNSYFWLKKERTILIFSIVFLLMHSILFGQPRFATTISWIYIAFFIKFISWLRLKTLKSI